MTQVKIAEAQQRLPDLLAAEFKATIILECVIGQRRVKGTNVQAVNELDWRVSA